nr:helicase C-terminal domain-containing protein [Candidatus Njordarchaeum guaymaensis]
MSKYVDAVELTEKSMNKIGKSLYPEQKEMIDPMFESLQKKGVVFVGQGPTGMGKTYVIAGVTKALVAQGKRVCIAVPSYTHLNDVMGKHLSELEVPYARLRGLSSLEEHEGCPLLKGARPSTIFCSDVKGAKTGPNSERCSTIDCTVRREIRESSEQSVVLTVFHKLIYKTSLLKNFDVVIFDESHGLEPTLRHARLVRVPREGLEYITPIVQENKATLDGIKGSLERLARRQSAEVPAPFVEREIIEPLREILPEVKENLREMEEAGHRLDERAVSAYYSLHWAVDSLERMDYYRFVYHNEAVLGIPRRIDFIPFHGKKVSEDLSIALISATIESPKFHASDAGFQYNALAPPIQTDSTRLIEIRYKRRPIFGLVDGPILRKDLNDMGTYESGRLEANKIVAAITPSFRYPTLILCRNKQDARSIKLHLESMREVQERLYLFEDEDTARDLDSIETELNSQIDKGKNIIVTTAASRLWEGANLKGLRHLVIDALPYASPEPYEKFEKSSWGSWRTSRTFRFMIRRLQQGIGRLIRTDQDPWGIVAVVDGRFNAQWRTIKSVLPSYLTDPNIIRFVTRNRLKDELEDAIAKLERKAS